VNASASHRVGEVGLQVEPEEAKGNHRHDADDCSEYYGEPHCGLGQGVLGIPWGLTGVGGPGVTNRTGGQPPEFPISISGNTTSLPSKLKASLASFFSVQTPTKKYFKTPELFP
jgi:hypothetical protein